MGRRKLGDRLIGLYWRPHDQRFEVKWSAGGHSKAATRRTGEAAGRLADRLLRRFAAKPTAAEPALSDEQMTDFFGSNWREDARAFDAYVARLAEEVDSDER